MSTRYYTAHQASQKLGVSLSTLYAYVSRGMIRSEPDTVKRRRRYRAEDVDALLARKTEKNSGEKHLAEALHWGEPIGESELTLIQEGELYYRGRPVSEMMTACGFEEVVELLWGGYAREEGPAIPPELASLCDQCEPIQRFGLLLPWLSQQDRRAFDLRPEAVRATGSRILASLFSSLCDPAPSEALVEALSRVWAPGKRKVLEAALIACADHELNVSAFTARCVASAGATPYQVVTAGLAALSGFRHGGHSYRVEALFREVETLGPEEAIQSFLRRGAALPGFGHQLYPEGDPRGRDLLKLMEPLPPSMSLLIQAVERDLNEHPNLDFALVAIARTLELPAGAHVALFALGRCAGWIAHALEQYATGKLIRPRARYVGRLP